MHQVIKIIFNLIFLLPFVVISCGGNEGGNRSKSPNLEGEWQTDCESVGSNYQSKNVTFYSNLRYEYIEVTFADDGCISTPLLVLSSTGYYSVGDSDEYLEVDFSIDTIDLKSKDDTWTSNFNSANYCGASNWQTDVSQYVVGVDCSLDGGISTTSFADNNLDHEQIIDLSGESGILYMGSSFLEVNSARPTTVDPVVYSKQN